VEELANGEVPLVSSCSAINGDADDLNGDGKTFDEAAAGALALSADDRR
jgi:hypothetical protein